MDPTELAKNLGAFLSPFLPYLLKAGDKAAEKLGEQVGEKLVPGLGTRVWQTAQTLWGKLRPKVQAKPLVFTLRVVHLFDSQTARGVSPINFWALPVSWKDDSSCHHEPSF